MSTVRREKEHTSEARVSGWWHGSAFRDVVTTQGRPLQVLYPGRPSSSAGPDFRDALLITEDGELVRGDVEIHLKRSDWVAHGHHRDSRYNGVVLHLFLHSVGNGAVLEVGARVPEVLLDPPSGPTYPVARPLAAPLERLRALPPKELERVLDGAGERRFTAKAAVIMKGIRGGDAEEALYAGLMEALGYSQNRAQMLLLARGLSLRWLKAKVGPDMATMPLALEAALLGAAGLLPHQRGLSLPGPEEEGRALELKGLWQGMGRRAVVLQSGWASFRLRPQNQPLRRLLGASVLIGRYWHGGLVEGLRALLTGSPREAEKGVEAESRGFWSRHQDFHRPASPAPALVGRSRAREMVVNVVLPFFYAHSHLFGDRELGRMAMDLYRHYPPGQDNEITREVRELLSVPGEKGPVINSAMRQQGLIHLYHVLRGQSR